MAVDTTCYRHPDRRAGVSCQRCGRPICPSCMSDASVGFHCPECARGGRQKVYTARTLPGVASRPLVTYALVAANVAVFVYGIGQGGRGISGTDQMTIDGGLFGPAVAAGDWYRVVTAGFLHASILHLALNMYLLYLLGALLEPFLGRVAFAAAYFAALLTGSFGVLLTSPTELTVGASGAVFGLMGLAAVVQWSRGVNVFRGGLGGLIIINLVLTFAIPGISIGGHIGGLLGGLVAGWLLVDLPRRVPALPSAVPTLLVVALGLAAFGGALAVA
jgi:membrane associated rhomboid family serine protease